MNAAIEPALVGALQAAEGCVSSLGGKGYQLAWLLRYGLPVADFFVIPAAWSQQRRSGVPSSLKALLRRELTERGWLNMPLAVRSSAPGEDAASASFAGIYRSCLNVCGVEALVAAVEDVWASLDAPTATAYRQRLAFAGEAEIAVVVMPLLPAKASGQGFRHCLHLRSTQRARRSLGGARPLGAGRNPGGR